ncbi:MAG: choice-of-anchor R domain-containing protein [Planctomycetota bacterium]
MTSIARTLFPTFFVLLPVFSSHLLSEMLHMKNYLQCAVMIGLSAVVSLAGGSARAGIVVYGNLGSTGTGAIAASGGVPLTTGTNWRAIGFTVGGTNTFLQTATIGLNVNSAGSANVRLDLYSNNAGVPGTSLFSTTQTLAANTLNLPISFNLNQTLTSGSTYWIVAQKTGGAGVVAWRPDSTSSAPTTQNASGWANLGNATGITSSNNGATWGSTGNGSSSSISLVAVVPEPSKVAVMAAAGGLATILRLRRSRRGVSPAASS